MEIEKTLTVAAPAARIWALLLDPQVMGGCVPGMQSIEVVSDVEYVSQIHVKIAFVSAKFKIKTTIVEQRAPHYLRSEGTGEDTSVASSLKQQSEVFLTELPDGQTELRIKVKVDVLGRLGTFGLTVMKTKADRMWDEFCTHLVARIAPQAAEAGAAPVPAAPAATAPAPAPLQAPPVAATAVAARPVAPTSTAGVAPAPVAPQSQAVATSATAAVARPAAAVHIDTGPARWWSRWFGRAPRRTPDDICIEIRRGDTVVHVLWPVQGAQDCSQWLRDYLKQPT